MEDQYEYLTEKQKLILATLLSSKTRTEAAEKLGVTRSTLWRWLQDEDLREAVEEAEQASYKAASASVINAGELAVEVLIGLCTNPKCAFYVKHAAARTLLEYGLKLKEVDDLERAIADLQRRVYE